AEVTEHVFVAALAEGLQHWTTARVTPVNARLVAAESRIEARVVFDESRSPASNDRHAVEFAFETSNEIDHHVTVRWENGTAGIVEVDRFSLDRPLAGDVLITHHRDRPGMIGKIGIILGQYEVNIAGMQVGRHHRGGEAIMVLNVDDAIPRDALDEIMAIDDVNTAFVVSLPNADPTWVQEPVVSRLVEVG
ncbi:MAG TPA: ACT domain-containing protein, partial [Thermomicrobiales bacterium]|nr:ACT domain-containing protein [Thermomicrobiales bacterium]